MPTGETIKQTPTNYGTSAPDTSVFTAQLGLFGRLGLRRAKLDRNLAFPATSVGASSARLGPQLELSRGVQSPEAQWRHPRKRSQDPVWAGIFDFIGWDLNDKHGDDVLEGSRRSFPRTRLAFDRETHKN
ncbi:unnamed protein product [Pieris macdunnoughi]|uniref:Uncharacterized protein n=1 Tax=Pieris macdunnoughi TaxID=345717 RepID=A0A821Y9F8_9NEOP|nr:unnamed protein product [Pieris macdunnoughi]